MADAPAPPNRPSDGDADPGGAGATASGLPVDRRIWPLGARESAHRASLEDEVAFWSRVARKEVEWIRPFTRGLDWEPPFARWFPDGTLNVAQNCLDRHLDGPTRNKVAYYWEGETGKTRTLSYAQLHREVNRLASALDRRGFHRGDFAAIYLPMIPELPIAMLALARLGITFTTVFSGFSAEALGARIRDTGAPLVITADGGYRRGRVVPLKAIVDDALKGTRSVRTVLVARRTGETVPMTPGRDLAWDEFLATGRAAIPPVELPANHVLFMLYSSGTTGAPKAIAHSSGGYLAHVSATMRWVFDLRPEDVYWCAADVGWVTGHSYIVFGPLAVGATSVLYEGAFDFPHPGRLWEMVDRYRATILYTSPTALRSLRKYGDEVVGRYDLRTLRLLGTVGEAINPDVWHWYFEKIGGGRCPIVDTWWQTETGGILISPAPGLSLVPLKAGSATFPLPGIEADVVDEHGERTRPGQKGYLVIRRPWPGMLLTLFRDDERYRQAYWSRFPGLYYAGDFCVRDEDGYFWFLGRADEVLKVAGHRLGTIEIEDALLAFPGIAEAAVCGRADPTKGEVPVAFVVLRQDVGADPSLPGKLQAHVARTIGKIAQPEDVYVVRMLPRTRSGKIMRRVVKAVADGQAQVGDVSTLEDEASVEEIQHAIAAFAEAVAGGR
jgi:acetyl-CoA synthetase